MNNQPKNDESWRPTPVYNEDVWTQNPTLIEWILTKLRIRRTNER
jgi:hypothetical protein